MKDKVKQVEKKLMKIVKGRYPNVKKVGRTYCNWCKRDRLAIETLDYKLICAYCGKKIPRLKEVEII